MAMAQAERLEMADLLASLTAGQWEVESLCRGWSVRDVAGHVLSYEDHGPGHVVRRFARAGFRFRNLNEVGLAEYSHLSPEELVDFYRSHVTPRGATSGLGGRIALVDGMIHHQDIRRPLGLRREIPEERLRVALPFAVTAPALRGGWKVRGTRVVATDVDFSHGWGPEARGPAEAVLMTLAGRGSAAHDLTGPGAETLQRRLAGGSRTA